MTSDGPLRIAIFGAHPADTVLNSGGTAAIHARQKDRILLIPVTYGARHCNPFLTPARTTGYPSFEEVKAKKLREIEKACEVLGVELCQLDFKDQLFQGTHEETQQLVDIIRDFRPDIVITHHPIDTAFSDQPDHATTGAAVLRAVKYANEWGADSKKPAFQVNTVLLWPARYETAMYRVTPYFAPANYYVDISEVIDLKRHAMRCLEGSMLLTEERTNAEIAERDAPIGRAVGVPYAEAYIYAHPFVVRHLARRTLGPVRDMLFPLGWTEQDYLGNLPPEK